MDEDLTQVLREAGLPEEDFTGVLGLLGEARGVALPRMEPSPELVALWSAAPASAASAAPARPRHRRRTVVLLLGLLGGAGVGTAAAATNALPDSVQEVVADFSDRFLPFDFPHPEGHGQEPARFQVPDETPVLSPSEPVPAEQPAGTDSGTGDPFEADEVPSSTPSPQPGPSTDPAAPASPAPQSPPASQTTPAPADGGPPEGVPAPVPNGATGGPGPAPDQALQQAPAPAAQDGPPGGATGSGASSTPDRGLLGDLTGGLVSMELLDLPLLGS